MHEASGQIISLPTAASGQRIPQKKLINLINAAHYSKKPLLINFFQPAYDFYITVKALPGPTAGNITEFLWIKDHHFPSSLLSFEILKITVTVGHKSCVFVPDSYQLTDRGIQLVLPDFALDDGARQHQRYACQSGLNATLTQNALTFPGCLLDYAPQGMVFELLPDTPWSPSLLNHISDATLVVNRDGQNVYSGTVHLARRSSESHFLLRPLNDKYPRHTPINNRARRQTIAPLPELHFTHPITGADCSLKTADIGSLGFCVLEKKENRTLIPGLILNDVRVCLASSELFTCQTQVVYCRPDTDNTDGLRCGLTILAIETIDHLKLIRLVQQAEDDKSYINNLVDPEDLFRFFFETGFIYPEKYAEIASHKEEYTATYKALYLQSMNISRHFIYQSPGCIQGHFATLQIYRRTWINQHHAALPNHRAGMRVVRAISEFLNDSYRIDSNNIRYIIGYYQPNNKFPRHFFGEFVRRTQDKTKTSLDEFAYFQDTKHFDIGFFNPKASLAAPWTLTSATRVDVLQFGAFYKQHSGGLMPLALDLTADDYCNKNIADTYSANGLYRSRQVFALRYKGDLCALIDVQQSSRGLNLSEITNALSFFFLSCPDREATHSAVKTVVTLLANNYRKEKHPVMIYPAETASFLGFIPKKMYVLWALDIVTGADSYMDWMNKFCR